MNIFSIKTREFNPPKDSLEDLLNYIVSHLRESDVVAISSKVASIVQGDCVRETKVDKEKLIRAESDIVLSAKHANALLTKKNDMLLEYGGVDYLRSSGYYVLLPKHPYKLAKNIWMELRARCSVENIGVVITDSHSVPFRKGAIGMAISGYGFKPVDIHEKRVRITTGTKRIRSMSDMLDSIAAAANLVMGEANESTPLAIVRDVPEIEFFDKELPESAVRSMMMVDSRSEVYDF